jgi:hypothetical protein
MWMVCPLIRDRVESSTSLSDVVVEGYDNDSGTISCTLYSQHEDNGVVGELDWDTQTSSTLGRMQLEFNDIDMSSDNEGSLSIECYLTMGSSIYHVYVNEDTSAAE